MPRITKKKTKKANKLALKKPALKQPAQKKTEAPDYKTLSFRIKPDLFKVAELCDIGGWTTSMLVGACHSLAKRSGWWNDPKTGDPLYVYDEVPKKLLLVHSEISEAVEGFRKDLMDDHLPDRKMVEVELADAMIRIADLAGAMGLDLGGALSAKLAYNQRRADHKPEARTQKGGKTF